MATIIISETFSDDNNCMPWDEAIEQLHGRALEDDTIDKSWSSIDGEPSDEWRGPGRSRRKYLLQEDKRGGGLDFELNNNCQVGRYFQIAHRVSSLNAKSYPTTVLENCNRLTFSFPTSGTEPVPYHVSSSGRRRDCLYFG